MDMIDAILAAKIKPREKERQIKTLQKLAKNDC